jgi:hypothetical protein
VLLLAIEARQMFCRALVGRRGEDVLCSNVPKSTIVCPCVKTDIAPNLLEIKAASISMMTGPID